MDLSTTSDVLPRHRRAPATTGAPDATGPTPLPPGRPRKARKSLSTPVRIRVLAYVFAGLVVVLSTLLVVEARRERAGIDVIGHQTAPVVVASTDLYFALNDMDAQLANILLVGSDTKLGFTRDDALTIYHQRRHQVSVDLQQAAAAAEADPRGAQNIRNILDALGQYETLAAQMIQLDGQAGHAAGQPTQATLVRYRQATDLLKATLLPAAQDLIDSNTRTLNRTYLDERGKAFGARTWVVGLGVALLAVVLLLQVYLARRFHRWINPAIVLATLIAAGLVISGTMLTGDEAEYLRATKKDAFDSILALNQARAVSYDANADESRYLVDPERADTYEKAFLTKTLQLVSLSGATVPTFDQRFATALRAYQQDNKSIEWYGYYGTEFRNITFVGERAAAEATLQKYQVYQVDDRRIRKLTTSGRLRDAIAFCTSYDPGQSNWAFDQYDKALAALIGINQHAFEGSIAGGEHRLRGWTVIPVVAGVAVLGLLLLGLRRRLAEYQVPRNGRVPE